ncbi:hypothetical protein CALVIDRAFT_307800 [Calocera viscosa TUFC12733]|uniref:F-box domain-containing protein n=1 Tax=Calocera viscosa (strain TUFC12733) TaxID=1330018 RepID=A0A167ID04_CALVF|nr:hypothetical protein CALVIDRAFT_307800 [Calocera viscosa TUFC12733]
MDVGLLLRSATPPRRLVALRERITALEFPSLTTANLSIHELEGILPQLDIRALRFSEFSFSDPTPWTQLENMEAVLQLTPSLQHLELCANFFSLAIDCATFLEVARKHASHLNTLILQNVPTTFGQLSSLTLRNLEVLVNINRPQSSGKRVLAFCQLLERTPALERLIIQDRAADDRVEHTSYLHALTSPPQLLRLRCVRLDTWSPILASAYLALVSRSNLQDLSFTPFPYSPRLHLWNIEQLRAWSQLKVLGLPPLKRLIFGVFDALTALEDLECGRDDFLHQLSLVSQGTTIFPDLNTLRISSVGDWQDGDGSIAGFLRARDNAGIPLQRLLVHGPVVTRFFEVERDLGGVNVQIGRYRPRDGFEGVTATLEPVDELFSEAELKKYGLWDERKPKGRWAFWNG